MEDITTSPILTIRLRCLHRSHLRERLRLQGTNEAIKRLLTALKREPNIRQLKFSHSNRSLTLEFHQPEGQKNLRQLLNNIAGLNIKLCGSGWDIAQQASTSTQTEDLHGWHIPALQQIFETLQSSAEGLTPQQAADRLAQQGPNLLSELQQRSDWQIIKQQFMSAPVAMLGVSAAIALLTSAPVDAAVIAVVVGANASIGFLTERQAEATIASLAKVEGQQFKVLRGGKNIEIDAEQIVRGDILLLDPGTQLPADARLVSAHHLTVDESSLTGESLPVVKRAKDNSDAKVLAERQNMVHLGTVVSGGDGQALVVETGDHTELGKIQALAADSQQPKTPMQQQLDATSTQLAAFSAGICALVFVLGLLRGQPRLEMLNTAISLAVAAVPEGLPAISSSLLAIGIRRMGKHNVLARRLEAIENLGAIDVLCLDKTGTLTENRMQMVESITPDADPLFWQVLALCNEAELKDKNLDPTDDGNWSGSATEIALAQAAQQSGLELEQLRSDKPRQKVFYRSEQRPYMVTQHEDKEHLFYAVKGRPRQVLNQCRYVRQNGELIELTDEMRDDIMASNRELMDKAYRVLGVACGYSEDQDSSSEWNDDQQALQWLGLTALADPLRPEVSEFLPLLQQAGIRTIILTGDQLGTAAAIGKAAGLNGDGDVRVLGAEQLAQLSQGELLEEIKHTHVFARVSPAMKLKLVQALQQSGHRVAMTGDGINDGPALRVADVGIAMGKNGSDVARSMADVVLADDHLPATLEAVSHGRASYSNLQKAIEYLLSTNFSEIQVSLAAISAGLPSPLSPIQLLWINLITDVFPALAIGFEEPEADVLRQSPKAFASGVIDRERLPKLIQQSLTISSGALSSYFYGLLRYGVGPKANSQAFMTLSLAQLLQSLSSRSRSSSLLKPNAPNTTAANPLLKTTVGVSLALQLATALPGIRKLFGVTPLGPLDWAVTLAGAVVPLLVNEALKDQDNANDV